jgi:hypothetical protein
MKLLNNSMKHIHHILPKYLGGTDDPSNLVELTVEEHAEAHRLLFEQHSNWQDYCAWQALSGRIGQEEALRMAQGMANKGKKRTDEEKERYSKGAKKYLQRLKDEGRWEDINKKRSKSHKGKKKSAEHLANWAASRKGHVVSEETRAKIRATLAQTRAKKKALIS